MLKIINELNKYRITFEDIAYEWINIKKKQIKKSTYSTYCYSIRKFLMPEFQTMTLKKMESYDYNEFVEILSQNLSTKTIRDVINNLKSILLLAEQKYYCKMKISEIKVPKLDLEQLEILSDKERIKLENYCIKENSLRSIGIIICLYTGLRVGEICALKWKNIDLEKRELQIKYTLQRIYDENQKNTKINLDTAKTKTSIRKIPISNKLYNILVKLKDKYDDKDYFLTGNSKKFIEPRNYLNIFKNYLKKVKLKKSYKFHILRHTFATHCIEVGMDIKSLSEILGHANSQITLNIYVHSSYNRKKKYLEKL